MSQIELDDIKRYCQAADYTVDDSLLSELQVAAEEYAQSYTRRDLDTEFPAAWPDGCCQAVKILVAAWYRDREAEVPEGVRDMLKPFRDMS